MEMFLIFLAYHVASVHTERCEIFAKLNHFRSAVFLQNSAVLREQLYSLRRKYCEQKSGKFGGNVAFLMRFGPFFYDKHKARQDKMFILTLMLYCTLKSCKIQVVKVATKQKF